MVMPLLMQSVTILTNKEKPTMAFNRSSIDLGSRYAQQAANSDSYGEARQSFMDWAGVKLKFFTMKKEMDRVNLNILPYQIKSPKHPEVVAGRRKVGQWDYLLDVWVHRNLGPNKKDMLCPKATYGKACPACEERQKLRDEGRDEEARAFSPSRRTIYNIQLIGRNGPEDAPMIFATSHHCFNKELIEEAASSSKGPVPVPFASIGPDGKVVSFRVSEKDLGTNKFCEAKSFQFLDRDEEVSDEVLEQCVSLDEHLIVPTSKQILDAMYGNDEDEAIGQAQEPDTQEDSRRDSYDDSPARRRPEPEPEYEDNPPPRQERRRPSYEDDAPQRERRRPEVAEESRDPYPPQPSIRPEENAPSMPFDEAEEAPRQERRRPEPPREEIPRQSTQCPHGLNWGTDCDRHNACGTCPDAIYDKCRAAGSRRR